MVGKSCKATKQNGQPCGAWVVGGGEFCFVHSPDRAADRAAARKRGGLARHAKHGGNPALVPGTIRDLPGVLALLDYTKAEIFELDNGIPRARALIALAGEYTNAIKIGELETRLSELERLVYGNHKQAIG